MTTWLRSLKLYEIIDLFNYQLFCKINDNIKAKWEFLPTQQ